MAFHCMNVKQQLTGDAPWLTYYGPDSTTGNCRELDRLIQADHAAAWRTVAESACMPQ